MCGRYTLVTPRDRLEERFVFRAADLPFAIRYNVAPSQQVLAVLGDEDGRRHGELLRWGLIPLWAKDPAIGSRMINARAETVAEKPSFRRALQTRRCLVLADSFYEWRREGAKKVPMRVLLKSREPFAFAGLWDAWKAPAGEVIRSCTIVTTTPNDLIAAIHNRMPVILAQDAEARWLDPGLADPAALTPLLVPYPTEEMEAYPVSPLVNSPRNDVPVCIAPRA